MGLYTSWRDPFNPVMVTAEANGRRTRRARCVTIGEEELFKME